MKIWQRLFLAHLMMLAFTSVVIVISLNQTSNIGNAFRHHHSQTLKELNNLHILRYAGLRIVSSTSEFLVLDRQKHHLSEAEELALIKKGIKAFGTAMQRYSAIIDLEPDDTHEIKFRDTIQERGNKLIGLSRKLVKATQTNEPAFALHELVVELEDAEQEFLQPISEEITRESNETNEEVEEISQSIKQAEKGIGYGLIVVVVVILVLSFWVSRSISQPLGDLETATKKIIKGDYFVTPAEGAGGEIGSLGKSFSHMAKEIQKQHKEIKERQVELIQFQKVESLGSLTAGIAHNLNNLLHPIGMYSQMLLEDFPENSGERDSIERIIDSNKRARDLVTQLMEYSRQQKGIKSSQSIYSVVYDVISIAENTLPKSATLHKNLDNNLGNVSLNKSQIQAVVLNLLSNAVDALQENVGDITITLSKKGTFACINVIDTGKGIDDEIREKMFDPFYTTKEVGKGTGLGLSTAQGNVKDHGGEINCSSSLGIGTTFEVLLPLGSGEQPSDKAK